MSIGYFRIVQEKKNRVEVQGNTVVSILYRSKQRKMQIIPLNLDSVLLFLHNSKLAYYNIFLVFKETVVLCE